MILEKFNCTKILHAPTILEYWFNKSVTNQHQKQLKSHENQQNHIHHKAHKHISISNTTRSEALQASLVRTLAKMFIALAIIRIYVIDFIHYLLQIAIFIYDNSCEFRACVVILCLFAQFKSIFPQSTNSFVYLFYFGFIWKKNFHFFEEKSKRRHVCGCLI